MLFSIEIGVYVLLTTYVVLIFFLLKGITALSTFLIPTTHKVTTRFSVVIPFRDEADNLLLLLRSIASLNYLKEYFEVLLVNDDSSDDSLKIIQHFRQQYPDLDIRILQNIRHSKSPKKDAIHTAVSASKYDWILTTDADCMLPVNWLQAYDAFILKNKVKCLAGAVSYFERKGFLHQFQNLDWVSLSAVTMSGFGLGEPLLCSGANLGYQKEAFKSVDGFSGNDQIASGDDIFILQKMKQAYPNQVFFLSSPQAIVQTHSVSSWGALLQQRIRWAAKTTKISNNWLKSIGVLVFMTNFCLLFLLGYSLIVQSGWLLLQSFFIKLFIDSLLLYAASKKLQQPFKFRFFLLSSIGYPFFSVGVVFLSFFTSYQWKGRSFSK